MRGFILFTLTIIITLLFLLSSSASSNQIQNNNEDDALDSTLDFELFADFKIRADNTSTNGTNSTDCSQFNNDCSLCTANTVCGYCPSTASCLTGTAAGPTYPGVCPVPAGSFPWQYANCTYTGSCSIHTDCFNCTSDPLCGWCKSLRRCSEGDATGPTLPINCPAGPPDYVSDPVNCNTVQPSIGQYQLAIFSPFGNTIIITFSEDTNRINISGFFDCNYLVTAENYTSLGINGATCFWQSSSVLIIRLGTNATIVPGQELNLYQNLLASRFNNSNFLNETSGFVQAPYFPDAPVASIDAPHYVLANQTLVLDGSNSYGDGSRSFVGGYLWSLLNPITNATGPNNDTALVDLLFRDNGPIVVIPSSFLTPGRTYVFGLTVSSFLNSYVGADLTTTTNVSINVVSEPRLQTAIAGPKNVFTHHLNPLALQANVGNPTQCVINASPNYLYPMTGTEVIDSPYPNQCDEEGIVNYAWVRSAGPLITDIENQTQSSSVLAIPQGSLLGGNNYQITLVTSRDNLLYGVGRDFVNVQVYLDDLVPVISGGNRVQSRLNPITLDASQSYDPNGFPGNIIYQWAAYRIDGADLGTSTLAFPSSPLDVLNNLLLNRVSSMSGSNITIPPFTLLPGVYSFVLSVSKVLPNGNFIASKASSTTIVLTWYDSPSVTIGISSTVQDYQPTRPQSTDTITLQGYAISNRTGAPIVSYQYQITDGDITIDNPGINWNGGSTLQIRPGTLTPGGYYTIRLLAWDSNYVNGASFAGEANITLMVNNAPNGGYCTVDPTNGTASFTRFNISCRNWADDKFDYPLFYRFFADNGDGTQFPLNNNYVIDDTIYALMPNSPTGNVQISYQVLDRWGATTNYLMSAGTVQIEPYATSGSYLQDAQDQINNNLAPILRTGEVATIAQTVYTILTNLNAEGAQNNINNNNNPGSSGSSNYSANPFLASQEEYIRQQLLQAARDRLPLDNSEAAGTQLLNIIWELTGGNYRASVARRIAAGRAINNNNNNNNDNNNLQSRQRRYCPDVINFTDPNAGRPIELGLAYFLRSVVNSGRSTSYDNVQLALNAASNLIHFSQPLIENNTTVGYQFAAQVVSAISELMIQQENVLTAGTGALNWTSPYIDLSVRKDYPCTLQNYYSFEGGYNGIGAVGNNVTVQLPANLPSLLTTPTITTGIIIYYNNPFNFPSQLGNSYYYNSTFPLNQPYLVNETFGQLNYPDARVQSNIGNASDEIVSAAVVTVALFYNGTQVVFPRLTYPLIITFPNNLQGSSGYPNNNNNNTNNNNNQPLSFEDQVDLYGVQCQRWYWTGQNDATFDPFNANISTSGWVVPNCTWSINRVTQYSSCSCYEIQSTYAAAVAPLAVIPGAIIQPTTTIGDRFSSSSRNWNWYFLPIVVFLGVLLLCCLFVFALFSKSQQESGELETQIAYLTTMTTKETGPAKLLDSPRPREIEVDTEDPLRSIELRKPILSSGAVKYIGQDGREYDSPPSSRGGGSYRSGTGTDRSSNRKEKRGGKRSVSRSASPNTETASETPRSDVSKGVGGGKSTSVVTTTTKGIAPVSSVGSAVPSSKSESPRTASPNTESDDESPPSTTTNNTLQKPKSTSPVVAAVVPVTTTTKADSGSDEEEEESEYESPRSEVSAASAKSVDKASPHTTTTTVVAAPDEGSERSRSRSGSVVSAKSADKESEEESPEEESDQDTHTTPTPSQQQQQQRVITDKRRDSKGSDEDESEEEEEEEEEEESQEEESEEEERRGERRGEEQKRGDSDGSDEETQESENETESDEDDEPPRKAGGKGGKGNGGGGGQHGNFITTGD